MENTNRHVVYNFKLENFCNFPTYINYLHIYAPKRLELFVTKSKTIHVKCDRIKKKLNKNQSKIA